MRKSFLIWRQTYRRSVLHPAFLMFTFGLPGFIVLFSGLTGYFALKATEGDNRPVGVVVTQVSLLAPAETWQPVNVFEKVVALRSFANEPQAAAALQAGTLQAYYVVPADYVTNGAVIEVTANGVGERVRIQMQSYLTQGLLTTLSPEQRIRLGEGVTLLHRSLLDQRELTYQLAFQGGLAIFILLAFYFINSSSSSDMLQALREEKDKKTIEISLTSATIEQLLIGKVGGIVSAGLTQFAVWLGGAMALAWIGWQLFRPPGLTLAIEPLLNTLALCLALLLPAYVMGATGVVVINSILDLAGRGEQVISTITNLFGTLAGPLAFIALSAPDNPLAVVLSLLPFTSPMIMVTRYVLVIVPAWQIALSIGLVWGAMAFNILIAARVYRAAWLLAGQRNWLRAIWWAVTGNKFGGLPNRP